jgi:thiol-disulfide isomerase/thioredoxin
LSRSLALLSLLAFLLPLPSRSATLDLASYRGKVVLLDFWASWCEPCRHSFPWLSAMQEKYGPDGLVVIGVNVDRERAEADRFLASTPARFSLVYDPEGGLAAQYNLMGMPSSFLFDAEGRLVATHVGFRQNLREQREAELRAALFERKEASVPAQPKRGAP